MAGVEERAGDGAGAPDERALPEVSLLIPCLNEEQNVPSVVDKLVRLLEETGLDGEILIIDDCSDDYTFREALLLSNRYPHVRALHKGLPRGIGHAIRFGLKHARGQVGVVCMGDAVDPIAAIPDFRARVLEHGADLVLLSRYAEPGDAATIPWSYRIYQWLYRHLCRLAVGLPFRDPTYAFRGFNIEFARSLDLRSGGFEISPELTLKTWLRGGRIDELRGRQGRRIAGESKFVFSRQAYGYARVLVAAALAYRSGTFGRVRRGGASARVRAPQQEDGDWRRSGSRRRSTTRR
jgi:glycosyltransferase involved in cell wall biosynthesis